MNEKTPNLPEALRTRHRTHRLAWFALALAVVVGPGSAGAFADGRVVLVGPNQGPVPLGPNERVTAARTEVINGVPTTVVMVETFPPKPKFVIGLPLPFPPGVMMYFPFPQDREKDGVHISHEVWVNSPGGGVPDNLQVVSVSCRPGVARCEGCKVTFPPGAILIPDPPQPAGLKFMVDRYPADSATETAVLTAMQRPDNPWSEVWILVTGDFYFFTDNNPPGPPVRMRPAFQPGDLNCDNVIDALDIQPFVSALLDANLYSTNSPDCGFFYADMNADATVNAADVEPFIGKLLEP